MAEKRDLTLDFLKGVACVLMIIAHSKLKMWGYEKFIFWGNLAPALFFGISGVTATFQAGKYQIKDVFFSSLFIFFLGFSYNATRDVGFLDHVQFEIIQAIALGSFTVFLLEKFLKPRSWVYFVLGFLCFGLNLCILSLLAGREFSWVTGIWIAPGLFPYLPWLSLFMLGVFVFRTGNLQNGILFGGLGLLYYLLYSTNVPDVDTAKWYFQFDYFLGCVLALLFGFLLVRILNLFRFPLIAEPFLFWGRNSLLFLYFHYAFIKFFRDMEMQREVDVIWNHPYLFWLLVLVCTSVAIFGTNLLARYMGFIFERIWAWLILAGLVFLLPLFLHMENTVYYAELTIGILFAAFYPVLNKLLKHGDVKITAQTGGD